MTDLQQLSFLTNLGLIRPTGQTENPQDEDLSEIAISLQTADGQPLPEEATIPPELLVKA